MTTRLPRVDSLAALGRAISAIHKAAGDCMCGLNGSPKCDLCRNRYEDAALLASLRNAIRTGRVQPAAKGGGAMSARRNVTVEGVTWEYIEYDGLESWRDWLTGKTAHSAHHCALNRIAELEAQVEAQRVEVTRLRAALAVAKDPCVYCQLPADEMARCRSGFPGCARADDMTGCPEFGSALQVYHLEERLGYLESQIEELREQNAALDERDTQVCALIPTRYMDPPDGGDPGTVEMVRRMAADAAQVERYRALLLDVAASGVEYSDPRIDYCTVQVDTDTWREVRALAEEAGR